jgi:hypothetical protein
MRHTCLDPAACYTPMLLQPGDRFAFGLDGNTTSSYYQADGIGPWTELESTSIDPLLDLTNPATFSLGAFAPACVENVPVRRKERCYLVRYRRTAWHNQVFPGMS